MHLMKEDEIKSLKEKIIKLPDHLLLQKPFGSGMYLFTMFIIRYYTRVREQLKIDYDSFIILQTVVSHSLYLLSKKKGESQSYSELATEWEKLIINKKADVLEEVADYSSTKKKLKLSISSICLVTTLPKETTRRKVNELINKNFLKISKKEGIILGSQYKKVFQNYVPETVKDVSKLMKNWEKGGVLKSLLNFNP